MDVCMDYGVYNMYYTVYSIHKITHLEWCSCITVCDCELTCMCLSQHFWTVKYLILHKGLTTLHINMSVCQWKFDFFYHFRNI